MTLDVWTDGTDTPTVVDVKPRTVLRWEKENRGRSAAQLTDDAMQITYMYELAWIGLSKPGGDFAAWSAATDVTFAQDTPTVAAEPDPTSVAPPTGSVSG